ncbi:vacuolar ATP synthase subunit D [Clavispora lusitaniae ATCC 42720]|uniref:Vacuolar ATP synthase subunit D n=1 Tax=Clavispora lusitaniae (strain ATCC 42720) TaxID=306902 RepID=C4XX23_CLAL4|nr:vacuolar ATP synthase subunit D [Clavispora lusitaniae ATCC 42720]EEQ36373.1 vacuolar ATP synthase subunit D [Clavispora lusitaniae ATCC 42720]
MEGRTKQKEAHAPCSEDDIFFVVLQHICLLGRQSVDFFNNLTFCGLHVGGSLLLLLLVLLLLLSSRCGRSLVFVRWGVGVGIFSIFSFFGLFSFFVVFIISFKRRLLRRLFRLLCGNIDSFLLSNFLQPVELFSVQLVQFRVDVADGVLGSRNDNVLNGIHSSVGDLDDLVQNDERRLQRRQLHQSLDSSGVHHFGLSHSSTTPTQTGHFEIVDFLVEVALESGQVHTRNVLSLGLDLETGLLDTFLNSISNVVAGRISDLGQRKRCHSHHTAHFPLGIVDSSGDFSESLGQGLGLSFQQ